MMSASGLSEIVQAMRASQRAIRLACERQDEGWRLDVVRLRRMLASDLGRLGTEASGMTSPFSPGLVAFRGALLNLRNTLAEHQASWPAVSLDPTARNYRQSVERVRAAFTTLEAALAELDRAAPRAAHGDLKA